MAVVICGDSKVSSDLVSGDYEGPSSIDQSLVENHGADVKWMQFEIPLIQILLTILHLMYISSFLTGETYGETILVDFGPKVGFRLNPYQPPIFVHALLINISLLLRTQSKMGWRTIFIYSYAVTTINNGNDPCPIQFHT